MTYRKTTQTVEVTVEGPNEYDQYRITTVSGPGAWWPKGVFIGPHAKAVQKHIDTAPPERVLVEVDGKWLIGPNVRYEYAIWRIEDRENAERGSLPAEGVYAGQSAWDVIAANASDLDYRKLVPAALALAQYIDTIETKEES